MSRALDEGIRSSLNDGDHAEAFESIATALLSSKCGSLLEIELLGHTHSLDANAHFLRDGNAIAIPKLRLVQAFIHARNAFARCKSKNLGSSGQTIGKATAVMLLFDPEHLSAANARKRILEDAPSNSEDTTELLMYEKTLIDSLLTSPLHRHTKSPNLWSHRRWLMERHRDAGLTMDAAEDLRTVIFVSAERHPRNYYAWCHARHLVNAWEPTQADAAFSTMLGDAKRWCFGHPSDISGWIFLAFLLERWPAEAASVLSETTRLAKSFRWRNESVWCFLCNMMLAGRVAGPQQEQLDAACKALWEDMHESGQERRVLDSVLRWMQTETARTSVNSVSQLAPEVESNCRGE